MYDACVENLMIFPYYNEEALATKLYERAEEGDATCVSIIIKKAKQESVLDIMINLKSRQVITVQTHL